MSKIAGNCFFLFLSGMFFVLFGAPISLAKSEAKAIVVDEPNFDFGSLKLSEVRDLKVLKHDFRIKNQGNVPVKIRRISTSCGCATANPEKDEAKPGDFIVLGAQVNLEGRSGKNRSQVFVEFDNDEVVSLEMTYDVEVQAKLFPVRVGLEKDKSEKASVDVTAYLAFPFPIKEENLPKIALISTDNIISIAQKRCRIGKTRNEINGYYYCSIDFEGSIPAGVGSLSSDFILTQDGVEVARVPVVVAEKEAVSLKKNVVYVGSLKRGSRAPVSIEVSKAGARRVTGIQIEGLVPESTKIARLESGNEVISFEVTWDKIGLSTQKGVLSFDDGEKVLFSCAATVKKD